MSSSKKVKNSFNLGSVLYISGVVLSAICFVIIMTTISPALKEEVRYDLTASKGTRQEITPLDSGFGIVIPKINANSRVVKDIDPRNPSEYQEALSRGVAHAKGTALPGDIGNVFLFSHSSVDFWLATRYNSIFYLLNKLETGDKIILYYQDKKYTYLVDLKKIVDPTDTSALTKKTSDRQLTLMTCWPPGTSLQRLIVTAKIEN